jgi:hypothetical protein
MVVVVQSGRKCRAGAAGADARDSSRERRGRDMICRMIMVVKMVEWLVQAIESVSLRSRAARSSTRCTPHFSNSTRRELNGEEARFEAPRLETRYPHANSRQ